MNLTIEEFSMLREAMYSCKNTNLNENPSAFQAKRFFNNEENFKKVEEKLRFLLINKPVETTNEQPKLSNKIKEIENSLDYDDCVNPTIAKIDDKINAIVEYLG